MSSHSRLTSLLQNSLDYTGEFYNEICGDKKYKAFDCVVGDLNKPVELDPVALCGFPTRFTFYGNRTILKDIKRTDFFSPPVTGLSEGPLHVPSHHERVESSEKIAETLASKLEKETYSIIQGKKSIGILLSGGMDSRILAAVLRVVQIKYNTLQVTCFCWGREDSRDVVYARKIAESYGWWFEYFNISETTLLENIGYAAEAGCFYSALHLHAMPSVGRRAKVLGIEVILAGSYGDSIGRGEYSRVHVENLAPIEKKLDNWYGVIRQSLFDKNKSQILVDIKNYRRRFGFQPNLAINELDYQLHYMRNMLGSAMSVIGEHVPLAQAFTSREVVSYMWSLAPHCRTDDVYYHILSMLDKNLLEIPWARTGKPYLRNDVEPDRLPKDFHCYGDWSKNISNEIGSKIFSGELESLNFFNMAAVCNLHSAVSRKKYVKSGRMLEIILWLASLSVFLERNEVKPFSSNEFSEKISFKHKAQYYGSLANQYRHFHDG